MVSQIRKSKPLINYPKQAEIMNTSMKFSVRAVALLVTVCLLFTNVAAVQGNIRELDDSSSSDDVGRPVVPPRNPPLRGTVPQPRSNDVAEVLIRAGGFQTLIKLLFTAGLVDDLKSPGPITVFAPNNQGFPSGQALADFVKSEPLNELRAVLSYHVVPGLYRSTDLVDGMQLTTLQGQALTVSLRNGAMVNNARIVRADMSADNGIIHTIDNMLMVF